MRRKQRAGRDQGLGTEAFHSFRSCSAPGLGPALLLRAHFSLLLKQRVAGVRQGNSETPHTASPRPAGMDNRTLISLTKLPFPEARPGVAGPPQGFRQPMAANLVLQGGEQDN